MAENPQRRELPQVLIGLLVLSVALGVAIPVTAAIVMNGIRDVKQTRDSIVVTGSAKQPITANLALWNVSVASTAREPADAARSLRVKAAAVRTFLRDGALTGSDVGEPPLSVEPTSVQVPTGLAKPRFRAVPAYRVSQSFDVHTTNIDAVEKTAASADKLLLQGVDAFVAPIQYLSTELKAAKYGALRKATADARDRAATIAQGLGGRLGAVRSVHLGVYQITPRNSTDVSGEGINDTSSRAKDVTAVVTVTFAVDR
jgi:hypothetical protein